MNEVCPICGQYANTEIIYESNQGYTNSVGKFAAKQGGKYIGKSIGSLVGDLIGLSEVGELVGGMLGSYAAGAGLDEYALLFSDSSIASMISVSIVIGSGIQPTMNFPLLINGL